MSTTINLGRVQGYSAYEVAVQQGYVGTRDQWLASLKGEKGDTGDTGETGATGPQGPQGEQGEPAVAIENYVTVEADSQTTAATDVLPETGSADTVYRVANWNGAQYDDTAYTEYGWYNSAYKMLATRTPGIDDEPTENSANLVKSGGVAAKITELGQIEDNEEYIQASLDEDYKILEGIKKEGTKVINLPVEIEGVRHEVTDRLDFVSATVDNNYKILEAFNSNGEKFVGKFDEATEAMIRQLMPSIATNETIRIPLVDSNFTSPIPVVITGVKGSETAKYDFSIPLGTDAFNIRVKFKVTDNLLNQQKNARILKLGNVVINTSFANLYQYSTQVVYEGNTVTMLWPDFDGGVKYGDGSYMLGQYAFYIKYTGNEDGASVENDGEKLILKRGSITTEFPFSTYDTVSSLYDALKLLPDIEIDYKEVEGRTTDQLAVFPETQIKLTCYTRTNGVPTSEIQEYVDTPPLFIPYAIDDSWHQIEVVKIGNTVFASCDGATNAFEYSDSYDYSTLTLGDGNKMIFKDVVLSLNSSEDAEFYENGNRIVSSVNPAIIIFECHGIYNGTISESSEAPDNMATSTDRLYYVFGRMKSMGYVPVSIHDIGEFYAGNIELPKRCFSIIFDDFRWENCLNAAYRKVFRELGVYPALSIITDRNLPIIHNGSEITKKEAAEICLRNDFSLLSHTRNHKAIDCLRLSTLISEFTQNIYSADNCLVDGMVLVYPYGLDGSTSKYSLSTMKWLGYSLGIDVAVANTNYRSNLRGTDQYKLIRVEIGIRTSLDVIFNKII